MGDLINDLTQNILKEQEESMKQDIETPIFFEAYLENSCNGTRAYLQLHPEVTEKSAATLASRLLRKVDLTKLLAAHGITMWEHIEAIKAGASATTRDKDTGEELPDWRTRGFFRTMIDKWLAIST